MMDENGNLKGSVFFGYEAKEMYLAGAHLCLTFFFWRILVAFQPQENVLGIIFEVS